MLAYQCPLVPWAERKKLKNKSSRLAFFSSKGISHSIPLCCLEGVDIMTEFCIEVLFFTSSNMCTTQRKVWLWGWMIWAEQLSKQAKEILLWLVMIMLMIMIWGCCVQLVYRFFLSSHSHSIHSMLHVTLKTIYLAVVFHKNDLINCNFGLSS